MKKVHSIEISENDAGYEDRRNFKIDHYETSLTPTEILIKNKLFEFGDSQKEHDLNHIAVDEYFSSFQIDFQKITDKFPGKVKEVEDLYHFNSLGELLPEIFDEIVSEIGRDKYLNPEFLDCNSQKWISVILKQRDDDLGFEVPGSNDYSGDESVSFEDEFLRLLSNNKEAESVYDKYYNVDCSLWTLIHVQKYLIELVVDRIKSESKQINKTFGGGYRPISNKLVYELDSNSFFLWLADLNNSASEAFRESLQTRKLNELRHYAFSFVKKINPLS
jgi:hypothetical protein